MKTKNTLQMLFLLALAGLGVTGCGEEKAGFGSTVQELLENRTYYAFEYQNSFWSPVGLTFNEGDSVQLSPRKGDKQYGTFEIIEDSSFVLTLFDPKTAKPVKDICKFRYTAKLGDWLFECEKLNYQYLSEDIYKEAAEKFALKQLAAITWKGEQDKEGWRLIVENRSSLSFDSLVFCVNGDYCDGYEFTVLGKNVDLLKKDQNYRFPATDARLKPSLKPGDKLSIPLKEAVSRKTGRRFNPAELNVIEVYVQAKTRYLETHLEFSYTRLTESQ